MKKLELLVVEDTEKHLADAREYFGRDAIKDKVSVTYATTLLEAEEKLLGTKYDGVITDLFFPTGESDEQRDRDRKSELSVKLVSHVRGYEEFKAVDAWAYGDSLPPAGVFVVEAVRKLEIPYVISTDSYHHHRACEPVSKYLSAHHTWVETGKGLPACGEREVIGTSKDWKEAYTIIVETIEWVSLGKDPESYPWFQDRRDFRDSLIEKYGI
ncbi:hypothetical protein HYV87_02040 [Candidatus Woesearchaeota archaeon]|nr:hypothetical protein [Candidatus Woesearchaeota archaeon]MBI2581892.1 hypothetical protein [Candidatus Woesearchaeota archaeon]